MEKSLVRSSLVAQHVQGLVSLLLWLWLQLWHRFDQSLEFCMPQEQHPPQSIYWQPYCCHKEISLMSALFWKVCSGEVWDAPDDMICSELAHLEKDQERLLWLDYWGRFPASGFSCKAHLWGAEGWQKGGGALVPATTGEVMPWAVGGCGHSKRMRLSRKRVGEGRTDVLFPSLQHHLAHPPTCGRHLPLYV